MEAQDWQGAMVAPVVEVTEEDYQVLNTILVLAVSFVPPSAEPLAPAPAPPGPWQPLMAQCQAPQWA